jgi:ABC-2 type transport system permease protein
VIWTIIQISLRRLLHNRMELLLTFVVPIAFFSVFALIFGNGMGGGTTPKVKVVVVDEVASDESDAIIRSLRESVGLRFMDAPESSEEFSAEEASEMVRRGGATIGIVIKRDDQGEVVADLLADASDQVAPQVVSALVGRELMILRARKASGGRRVRARLAGEIQRADLMADVIRAPAEPSRAARVQEPRELSSPDQSLVRRPPLELDPFLAQSESESESEPDEASREPGGQTAEDPAVQIIDVLGDGKANPVVSMYAAGIAVMFLLFGATGGGGVLLEERENTTLDRLLSTQMTMDQLLLGKWFYLTALGFLQVSLMFLWGQLVFGVDLLGHLDGFVMMTLVTSSAAAAFGLFLATLCKTRGQLNGLSVILILTMSALGGSMVPRYVMSERMRELGQWTFNAWALDGYDKVFWREIPADSLWPQLAVLMAAGIGFLLVARLLAIRWEFD